MTWKITPGWTPADSDAAAYIAAVEAADGQTLENGVKVAIDNFVLGCKADGIWNAIKASCILAGARTLNGALVPLAGTAPTNNGFTPSNYNRKTGLVGADGPYLNSNRDNSTDPQNNQHVAVYVTAQGAGTNRYHFGLGTNTSGATNIASDSAGTRSRCRNATTDQPAASRIDSALLGVSRNDGSSYTLRGAGTSYLVSRGSQSPASGSIFIYGTNLSGTASQLSLARYAFYSIGESLNLALLDNRVTTLIAQFAAAIP